VYAASIIAPNIEYVLIIMSDDGNVKSIYDPFLLLVQHKNVGRAVPADVSFARRGVLHLAENTCIVEGEEHLQQR